MKSTHYEWNGESYLIDQDYSDGGIFAALYHQYFSAYGEMFDSAKEALAYLVNREDMLQLYANAVVNVETGEAVWTDSDKTSLWEAHGV